jgi:hypothetical protein
MSSDVTQGYIMVKPRLRMLRPIYLAHERRVFEAAGLADLLPKDQKPSDDEALIAELLKKAKNDPKLLEILMAEIRT